MENEKAGYPRRCKYHRKWMARCPEPCKCHPGRNPKKNQNRETQSQIKKVHFSFCYRNSFSFIPGIFFVFIHATEPFFDLWHFCSILCPQFCLIPIMFFSIRPSPVNGQFHFNLVLPWWAKILVDPADSKRATVSFAPEVIQTTRELRPLQDFLVVDSPTESHQCAQSIYIFHCITGVPRSTRKPNKDFHCCSIVLLSYVSTKTHSFWMVRVEDAHVPKKRLDTWGSWGGCMASFNEHIFRAGQLPPMATAQW